MSILQVRRLRPREIQSRGCSPVGGKWQAWHCSFRCPHHCGRVALGRTVSSVAMVSSPLCEMASGPLARACACAGQGKCVCGSCVLSVVGHGQLMLGRVPSPGLSCWSSSCSGVSWGLRKENKKAFPIYLILPVEFIHKLSG